MEFIVNSNLKKYGINNVVIGIARNVNPHAPFGKELEEKFKDTEARVLAMDYTSVSMQPVIQGYCKMLGRVGRSIKKNPPTVSALIRNIQHRGSIPRINSIVEIYNMESLKSYLSIGGHDLDKLRFPLEFMVSGREDTFFPIGSASKHVEPTDYVYRDENGVVAWLDVRDAEFAKLDDNTKNAIFIIQGNEETSVQMRVEALERIRDDLASCMPDMTFEILIV